MAKYEYLANPDVLSYIDSLTIRTQFIRILILDQEDKPIKAIQGNATGGNISLQNNSTYRRSGNLTLVTKIEKGIGENEIFHKVTEIDNLISINKRVSVEIGLENTGRDYPYYDIFWFPQGVFLVSNATVSYDSQGIQISVKLIDKMGLLSGEAGGLLTQPTLIYKKDQIEDWRLLVTNVVHNFGGIPYNKIVVEDLDFYSQAPYRWDNEAPLYADNNRQLTLKKPDTENPWTWEKRQTVGKASEYSKGLSYPKNISVEANTPVTAILDTIKNAVGNYEYFFDVDGVFHFREIKNYLNQGSPLETLTDAINEKYFLNLAGGKSLYQFNDKNIFTAFQHDPQYSKIKNDIILRAEVTEDRLTPYIYHLLVDTPLPEEYRFSMDSNNVVELLDEKDDKNDKDDNKERYPAADWRARLYLFACATSASKIEYFKTHPALKRELSENLLAEIKEFFPKTFSVSVEEDSGKYKTTTTESPFTASYYIDLLDTSKLYSGVDTYALSIKEIGQRPTVLLNEEVNCLFEKENDNIIRIVESGGGKPSDLKNNEFWVIDDSSKEDGIMAFLNRGSWYNPAFDKIRVALHEYINYHSTISLTAIPSYYLDVGQRISVKNEEADIDGDYVIQSLNIPLTLNGTMSITATKAIERI